MQKNKNITLLIIFLILVIANVLLMWFGSSQPKSSAVDPLKFTLIDSAGVDKISLTHAEHTIILEKGPSGWSVNKSYKMNDQMRVLLIAVLSSLQTKRAVDTSKGNPVGKLLSEKGVLVEVFQNGNSVMKFLTGGNTTKTVSYMMNDAEEIPYVVTIPGYSSFVAGLFALKEGDWRYKGIFNSTRNSFKSLYLQENATNSSLLKLSAKGQFFEIDGINKIDTSALYDYLQSTIGLEIDEYIAPGTYEDYDSLSLNAPEYILQITDFDSALNRSVSIFPLIPGDHQRLIAIQPGDIMATLRNNKVRQIIKDRQAFDIKGP